MPVQYLIGRRSPLDEPRLNSVWEGSLGASSSRSAYPDPGKETKVEMKSS